jgi:hypothetical protein
VIRVANLVSRQPWADDVPVHVHDAGTNTMQQRRM